MKKYEITYIIHPDLEGSIDKITEKVKSVIVKSKGAIIVEEDWGKKKLAYEINKSKFGIYEFLNIEIDPAKIKEVERTLRLSEEIIRSMIVLSDEGVESPEKITGVKSEKTAKKDTKQVEKEKADITEDNIVEKKEKEEPAIVEEKKTAKSEDKKEEKTRLEELDKKLKEIIGPDES